MPSENRKALLEEILRLAGTRKRQWSALGQDLRALPEPSPEQAAAEILACFARLTDDWNADLEVAHKRLSDETARLTESTRKLDVSTERLDRRTWHLILATYLLILATAFLAGTHFMGPRDAGPEPSRKSFSPAPSATPSTTAR
jgi:AcrR family transcriptional regulator